MFKRNEGILDRIVRVVLGMVLLPAGLFWLGGLQGAVLGLVAAALGVWVLITGVIGVCPLYIPFGISTLEKEQELMTRLTSTAASCWSGNPSAGQMCGPRPQSTEETRKPEA